VDERAQRYERFLQIPVLVAALAVVPALALEESSEEPWLTVGLALNWISWLVFATELVVMLVVVEDRRAWLRGHALDVAVTVLTPPFAPAALQGLRAARLLRVLRLLRLLRLVRAVQVAGRLFSPDGLRWAAFLVALVALGGAEAFALVEKDQDVDVWDGLWWAVTTMTTVGYGDIYPTTTAGRIVALVLMLTGIGFVALITGGVATRFLTPQAERVEQAAEDLEEAARDLERDDDALLEELREARTRLEQLERRIRERRPG